ncbi:DDE_3 domain-containing protein [Trichonephila clavipes]|nr:DDE_3 domain-containing protein [Trichonephila clavipes]
MYLCFGAPWAQNALTHRENIVSECLQSEDITRMDWPEFSLDLNLVEHVWDMLDRRVAARQLPPTYLPVLQRAFLNEWCNIPQGQIDNLKACLGVVWTVLHCLEDILCINH